jgi:SH3 domain-containing YSC84-like protein 1
MEGLILSPHLPLKLILTLRWSAPASIATIGVSWGALIGLDVTDYVLVLHDLEAVRAFTGQGQVSLGGEVKISLGGIGRTGAGEMLIGDHGLATALSYCHSKGLFAGVSLEGSMLLSRLDPFLSP